MKQVHCLYDNKVWVKCEVLSTTGRAYPYNGPRQLNCPDDFNCLTCGWNPEVEKKRKEQGIEIRKGHVNEDGVIRNKNAFYRGIKLKGESYEHTENK